VKYFQEQLPISGECLTPSVANAVLLLDKKNLGNSVESYITYITGPSFPWYDSLSYCIFQLFEECTDKTFGEVFTRYQERVSCIHFCNCFFVLSSFAVKINEMHEFMYSDSENLQQLLCLLLAHIDSW
jgi:hypothetical protein